MGQPDGDLSQSPEQSESCLLNKKESEENKTHVQPLQENIRVHKDNKIQELHNLSGCASGNVVGGTRSTCKSSDNIKLVSPVNDDKGDSDFHHTPDHEFHQPEHVIHSHQEDLHYHHPRLGSAESSDTVKNISEESGLSSNGDVSSSLSSSDSFSGSEDISPKPSEKEVLTAERSSREETEARRQEGIDVIPKQQEKLEEKCCGIDHGLDCRRNERKENNNEGQDDDGDQHVHGNDEEVAGKACNWSSSYCDTMSTNTVDEGVEISPQSIRGTRLSGSCSGCSKENSIIMMETTMTEQSSEDVEGKFVGKATGVVETGEAGCQAELSSHPPPAGNDDSATDGKNGNHPENIWTFSSLEMSSSTSCTPASVEAALENEMNEKEQNRQQNRDSRPATREKRRVFGLSGFGCRFNLNKIFFSSSSSSQRAATHLSTERLNNQLSTFPSGSQGVQSLTMGTTTLLSNVSKSSSESNILMCHNSLDNLTDELPSSRSTDSSCLLPTSAVDDHVLDHHHHHRLHHQAENEVEEEGCCCCCSCCCCRSNGTCDHLSGLHGKCIGHNSTNGTSSINAGSRCSSSPATVGRQRKTGNVNSNGKEEEEDDVDRANALLLAETNNNNHQEDLENCSNRFTDGNNSNPVEAVSKGSCNPSCATSSSSSSPASTERETVLRTGAGGSDDGDMGEEMRKTTACGSSASLSNRNRNGDARDSNSCSGNNCTGRCTAKPASDAAKQNSAVITIAPSFVNSLGKNSATCSSPSSSSSASPSCSTTSHNSCTSSGGSSSESKASRSGGGDDSCSSSTSSASLLLNSSHGQKFKLLSDGDVQVCRVKHGKNLVDKVIGSKLLRRWETHHLYLNDACISSKTPIGPMAAPVPYWQMEEVYVCVRLDSKRRYVIRIVIPDGSLLLQGSNAYVRDQWYYSILWKKNIYKYQNLMRSSKRPEVILKELKSLVNFATTTPLQDDCISHVPIEIVSNLLDSAGELLGKNQAEEVLVALSPLLERSHPPPSLCRFFSRYCRSRPRCPLVAQLFTPVVRRALKHNVDFGKYPFMRLFIQEYIQALNCHNDGINVVRNFVKSIHGPASSCPHPRVMSNLVSVCLAAMFQLFEKKLNKSLSSTAAYMESIQAKEIPYDEQLLCYLAIFDTISEFEDWRPSLAQLLQPIPFPDEALNNPLFTRSLSPIVRRIGTDHRCEVHQMVLGIRDGKEGWFHMFAPSSSSCFDDGELWGVMLERLLACCCRRKRFLSQLGGKLLGSSMLLALRENAAAQEALCLVLEWHLVQSDDQRVQIATTLQSTPTGSANYLALCNRQLHLKELQQKGGPRKLTLPSRSTDKDLAKLLSCGSFGNLECLSLAFTQVTSACAEQLIKLPSLRYLNLWCTQFGDPGLLLISEHLPNLQVLNLCETPVTDKGLSCLTCMTSLRKLNLNSTSLSAQTFERLKKSLPALKEIDVRYTDAW